MDPLRLVLHPIVPARVPAEHERTLAYGYRLRVPGGPIVGAGDPVLAAYGAAVVDVPPREEHDEALQDERFDPGSGVQLLAEPFDEDASGVRVWDAAAVREVGELPDPVAGLALAGLDLGLGTRGLVLSERRVLRDHRRVALTVLVHAPGLVDVAASPADGFPRPDRPARPRIVLFADGSGDVRWWDPAGTDGPADLTDLPISVDLARDLVDLRDAYAAAGDETTLDPLEAVWMRQELEQRARCLWWRARSELRWRYAVGFLGREMTRPAWTRWQLDGDQDDDDEPMYDDVPL